MKNNVLQTKNKDDRKNPASGYDEKKPNKQFPVDSGNKIKSTSNDRNKKLKK